MIQGLNNTLEEWDPILTRGLSERFKLILFDPPGSGRSELSDREPSIRLFADQTSRLMDILEISEAHVLGFSMGGCIAQELAINYPEKVQKVIICSSNCGGSKYVPSALQMEMMQAFMGNRGNLTKEDMVRNCLKICFSEEFTKMTQEFLRNRGNLTQEDMVRSNLKPAFTEEFVKNNPERFEGYIQRKLLVPTAEKGAIGQRKAVANFSTFERLHMIKAPTLILQGKKDAFLPPENGAILAKAIPKATLVYLENSAHYLAEEIEKVLETVMNFLD